MPRLRLYDLRVLSRLPEVIGLPQGNIPGIARYVNDAQRRLLTCKEAGDEGWWGTWAEMAFTMTKTQPYITLPREVARIEALAICNRPVPVQNQFYEYLQFGNGRLPKTRSTCSWPLKAAYTRNTVPTFVDLGPAPQNIQVFSSDPVDLDGKHRVLIQGSDNVGNVIYSQDGQRQVVGQFLVLQSPFAAMPTPMNTIMGVQKDVTSGQVQIFQVDPTTGASVLLLTMEPGETTASYRRYYIDSLPTDCCYGQSGTSLVSLTGIAKLDLIPVTVDTDYCLIQNSEAIIEECAAIRYSMVDNQAAKAMSEDRHANAVRFLMGELTHYVGKDTPAVSFKPFGSARLERLNIGMR